MYVDIAKYIKQRKEKEMCVFKTDFLKGNSEGKIENSMHTVFLYL